MFLLVCCGPRRVDGPQRMAVLPFENFSADPKLDWLSAACAAALVSDLAGMRQLHSFPADSVRSAYAARASEVLEASFEFVGDKLRVHAALEDLARHKIAREFSVEGLAREGMIPLVNQLAKQADAAAHVFSTRDPAAFSSFGQALSSSDSAAQARLLQTATVQDPAFSLSYLNWSQALLAGGDRTGAAQAAVAGVRHATDPLQRAQLELWSAVSRGDGGERERALINLSRLTPADPEVFRNLAQVHLQQRKFAESVRDLQAAARADPNNPAIFNSLGYSQAYARDLNGARQSLTTYQKLAPEGDFNPPDSLGEVNFYLGDFDAAQRWFLDAHQHNPGLRGGLELLKAAQARLLAGDRKNADDLFARYMDLRKNGDRVLNEYEHGAWEWLTGRRKQGRDRVQGLLPSTSADTAALLNQQLSIWNLQIGNRLQAARFAQDAGAQAVTPAAQSMAALCRFLAAPVLQGSAPPRSGNNLADAYALLLSGRFTEAIPPLENLYRETPPESDGQVRTLLAWAYCNAGRTRDAAALTELYPIPLTTNQDLFASLKFPRFLQLRSAVLQSQGKHDEAQRLARLYREYSGDLPDRPGY